MNDNLIEQLAIELHDASNCPHPFCSHTEESLENWRRLARVAFKFIKEHRKQN